MWFLCTCTCFLHQIEGGCLFQNPCLSRHWGAIWPRKVFAADFFAKALDSVHNSVWFQNLDLNCPCYNKSFCVMFSSHFHERLLGRLGASSWGSTQVWGGGTILLFLCHWQLTCILIITPPRPCSPQWWYQGWKAHDTGGCSKKWPGFKNSILVSSSLQPSLNISSVKAWVSVHGASKKVARQSKETRTWQMP